MGKAIRMSYQYSRQIFIFSILLTSLLFQNCLQQHSTVSQDFSSAFKNSEIASGGGDGNGFEGKLQFVRTIPELSCQSDPVSPSTVYQFFDVLNGETSVLYSNDLRKCQKEPQPFDSVFLERSSIQKSIVGYKDGLFFQKSDLLSNENQFLESWCRGQVEGFGTIELAVRQNYVADVAQSKLWALDAGQIQASDFLTTMRLQTKDQLQYATDQFQLKIDLKSGADTDFHYQAVFQMMKDQNIHTAAFQCRLGGSFDGLVWPAKLVDQKKILQFRKLKGNHIVYLAQTPDGSRQLYFQDQQQGKSKLLFQAEGVTDVHNFRWTSNEDVLVFLAHLHHSPLAGLYSYRFSTGVFEVLSGPLENPIENVDENYFLTPDDQYVIYRDGEKLLPGKTDAESRYLKSVHLETKNRLQLHPNLGTDLEPQIYLPFGSREVIFKIYDQIYRNNYEGSNLQQVALPESYFQNYQIIDILLGTGQSLAGQLFPWQRMASSFGSNSNPNFTQELYFYLAQKGFQTLKWNGSQNVWTVVSKDSLAEFITVNESVFFGINARNQNVLISSGQNYPIQGLYSEIVTDAEKTMTTSIEVDSMNKTSSLWTLDVYGNRSRRVEFSWDQFLTQARVQPQTQEIFVWQYDVLQKGFHLVLLSPSGEVKKVPSAFLSGQQLRDFQLIPNSSFAVVRVATSSIQDFSILSYSRHGLWKEQPLSFDLYLVSLDGEGARKISPSVSTGLGVQSFWPVSASEIYFSFGDQLQADQIYMWKSK